MREALPPGASLQQALGRVSRYDLFVFEHGYRTATPQVADLLTSMFLHGGFMHLVGNMLFLWIYGDNVEHRLGRVRYLLWYLATGAAATLFYALLAGRSNIPLVGASGAISGVLGFYFRWFPHNDVRVFVFLFPFFLNVVAIPARIVLGIYLVVDNLLPFVLTQGSQGGGVAFGAHIGGFLAGLAVAFVMDRREVTAAPREYRAPASGKAPTASEVLARHIDEGRFEEAARTYFAVPPAATRRLLEPVDSLALAEWLASTGHPEAALTVYRRHLRDYPTGPGAAEAHVGAGLVQFHDMGQAAPAYQHFLDALDLDPPPSTAAQARAALESITARQKYRLRRFNG
jgi:membrane associated rhomboid family serine protease